MTKTNVSTKAGTIGEHSVSPFNDPRPVANDKWPLRSTGVALSVAVGLLETTYPNTGARIMDFAGGPATEGPEMVVSNELKEPIRSHHEIGRDTVTHYKRANKVCTFRLCLLISLIVVFQFYEGLAVRASNNGHAIDLFSGSLDQVGLLQVEMRSLPNSTNGVVVLSDSFTTAIFKQSFLRIFNNDDRGHLSMGFNATFDVQVSFFLHFQLCIYLRTNESRRIDHKRAESIRSYWTCYFCWKEVRLRRKDRNWYWTNISMEG